jgi:hypothetical protein
MSIKNTLGPVKRGAPMVLLGISLVFLLLMSPVYETVKIYLHGVVHLSVNFEDLPGRRIIDKYIQGVAQLKLAVMKNTQPGLPAVRLYISQQAQRRLIDDPPSSLSDWQKASLMYEDGEIRDIKVRHRGDGNPINYRLTKKSWRIKTKRKALFRGVRKLNYVIPPTEDQIGELIVNRIGRKMGLLAPALRLVELFINDISHGIYFEVEQIDEILLRKNDRMPVNIYKGDVDLDRLRGFSSGLFWTPAIWTRSASSNRVLPNEIGDLERFLDLVRDAGSSEPDFEHLRQIAPFDVWARMSAYQILVQSWHNDRYHNQRIAIDDQSGTVEPIIWDVRGEWDDQPRMDVIAHPLLALYRRNSEFLFEEQKILYRYLTKIPVLSGTANYIGKLRPDISNSMMRDIGRFQSLSLARGFELMVNPTASISLHTDIIAVLKNREKSLLKTLSSAPRATWEHQNGDLELYLSGAAPLSNIEIGLESSGVQPTVLVIDSNGNREIDSSDVSLPFHTENGVLTVDATFLANRIVEPFHGSEFGVNYVAAKYTKIVTTRFDLIADVPLNIATVSGHNGLTGLAIPLVRERHKATRPFSYNHPVISDAAKTDPPTGMWEGTKRFVQTKVFDHPIRIEAGSRLILDPGVSIIFRGPVYVAGTKDEPVRVVGGGKLPWGALALQGEGTRGSQLVHLIVENGSGGIVDGIFYTAMFSIHSSRDIAVNNLTLRKNHDFDDMMHIVYGQNIKLNDLRLNGARADALDIDISSVSINGIHVENAGNDCIDFMTSSATIQRASLIGCEDKGISVGEATTAAILDAVVRDSGIGMEVKDRSIVQLLRADFLSNSIQIKASRKNWRYTDGGHVQVLNSVFKQQNGENIFETDVKSDITIYNSSLTDGAKMSSGVVASKSTDFSDSRLGSSEDYEVPLLPMMKTIDRHRFTTGRGAFAR